MGPLQLQHFSYALCSYSFSCMLFYMHTHTSTRDFHDTVGLHRIGFDAFNACMTLYSHNRHHYWHDLELMVRQLYIHLSRF